MEMRGKKSGMAAWFWYFFLALVLLGAVLLLLPVVRDYQHRRSALAREQAELSTLKEERARRFAERGALENSPAAVEKVAREKFNFVQEGETVMRYREPVGGKKTSGE